MNDHNDQFSDGVLVAHADRCWKAECENAERLGKRVNFMVTGLIALIGLGAFRLELLQRRDDVSRVHSPQAVMVLKFALTAAVVSFTWSAWKLVSRPERRRFGPRQRLRRLIHRISRRIHFVKGRANWQRRLAQLNRWLLSLHTFRQARHSRFRNSPTVWLWATVFPFPRKPHRDFASHSMELNRDFIRQLPITPANPCSLVFFSTYSAFIELRDRNQRRQRTIEKAQAPFSLGVAFMLASMLTFLWAGNP